MRFDEDGGRDASKQKRLKTPPHSGDEVSLEIHVRQLHHGAPEFVRNGWRSFRGGRHHARSAAKRVRRSNAFPSLYPSTRMRTCVAAALFLVEVALNTSALSFGAAAPWRRSIKMSMNGEVRRVSTARSSTSSRTVPTRQMFDEGFLHSGTCVLMMLCFASVPLSTPVLDANAGVT